MNNEATHSFFQDFNFFGFVHRGGAEEATENTLEAFQHASNMGFTFMETDVQATKDQQIVAFHDVDLSRMANVNKTVDELSFNEIKELNLLGGGKIPTLKELLSSFPSLRFNIDIKTENAVEGTVSIIKDLNAFNRVCIASFSSARLNRIRNIAGPKCCTSMGQNEIVNLLLRSYSLPFPKSVGHCAQVPVSQWGIPIVTKKFINCAHNENKLVHVWTINEEKEMNNLIDLGVDGLMTDRPSVLHKVLKDKNLI